MKIIFALIVLLIVLFLIDMFFSKPIITNGIVLDKQYYPGQVSIGTGVGTNSSGNSTIITTTQVTSEKFVIIVRKENNQIVTVESNAKKYYASKIGDLIDFNTYYGVFTHWIYEYSSFK